jgi:hypothetical protein
LYTGGRAGEVESRELKVERRKDNAVAPRLLRSSQKEAKGSPLGKIGINRKCCPTRVHRSDETELRSSAILMGWAEDDTHAL